MVKSVSHATHINLWLIFVLTFAFLSIMVPLSSNCVSVISNNHWIQLWSPLFSTFHIILLTLSKSSFFLSMLLASYLMVLRWHFLEWFSSAGLWNSSPYSTWRWIAEHACFVPCCFRCFSVNWLWNRKSHQGLSGWTVAAVAVVLLSMSCEVSSSKGAFQITEDFFVLNNSA